MLCGQQHNCLNDKFNHQLDVAILGITNLGIPLRDLNVVVTEARRCVLIF